MPKKPTKPSGPKSRTDDQWADCPRAQRAKIPNINLAARDVQNPCELAKEYGVPLSQLRVIPSRDGVSGEPVNDFLVAPRRSSPKFLAARKPK
jgi:hypothetical protein